MYGDNWGKFHTPEKNEYQIITYSLKPKQIIYKVILEFIMIDYGFWKKNEWVEVFMYEDKFNFHKSQLNLSCLVKKKTK